MQVAFQTDNNIQKNILAQSASSLSLGALKSSASFKNGQTELTAHKSQNETYGNSRVYSPFLAPSNAVILNIQSQQAVQEIVFMHNMARTKYFNVSKQPKPSDHNKVNLMA